MNAPFSPPTAGPDGDEPRLRSLLADEARREPPVGPDFRAGVDRRVRRHRARVAAIAAPAVAVVLAGAFVLAPRSGPATVSTASDGAEPTAEEVPAPDATAAPAVGTDCGTIELGPERVDPETGPIDCFISAFNAGTDATLGVVAHGPSGGTVTETVTTAPGKQITVTASGSLSVKIPGVLSGFGSGGGGLVPSESDSGATDCGTVTYVEGTQPTELSPETMRCLVGLVTSGSGGGFSVAVTDASGGTMTARVDVDASHSLTVSFDGRLTTTLPELTIPSDLTDHLPPNGFGLEGLSLAGPELGGLGYPGHGSDAGSEDTTVPGG